MSTYKMDISNNEILALSDNSWCRSDIVLQNVEDTDFESIKEVRSQKLLANQISGGFPSSADKAILNCNISEGDRIFIKDSSDMVHDTVASDVEVALGSMQGLIPEFLDNDDLLASDIVITSNIHTNQQQLLHVLFDSTDTYLYTDTIDGLLQEELYIQIEFPTLPINTISHLSFKVQLGPSPFFATIPKLYGSVDGIEWVLLYDEVSQLLYSDTSSLKELNFKGDYKFYRFYNFPTLGETAVIMYKLNLYSEQAYSINTSTITNGEVPTHVWKYTDTIKFNNTAAVEKDIFTQYGTKGNSLYLNSLYYDVPLSGRQLETFVEINATGNKVIDITGQVHKAL